MLWLGVEVVVHKVGSRDKDECDRQETYNVGNAQVPQHTSCSSEREDQVQVFKDARSSLVSYEHVALFGFSNKECSVCPVVV